MPLYTELRRRNIFKVAFVYFVGAALVVWLSQLVQTQLDLPWWTNRLVFILAVIGFPIAIMFAWVYEITPAGLKKAVEVDQTQSIVFKTGQKLNAALAVLVVLAAVAMIADRLLPELVIVPPPPAALDSPVSSDTPPEIRSFTLDNGLKIIVWPDHDIPNVVMYNFVRAGSRNEYPGITGLSHFFEHMTFNGSANVPPGDFDNIMEAAGGANNAYTSKDVTVYQDWFPRSALNTIFYLESERLGKLKIDPEVVESERGVVYSERRSGVDNDNFGMLYEQMMATAYAAHPYQFPVIGWPSDIENWTQDDLRNYYRTYYAPNNMTMVFAGDVSPREVYAYADEYLSGIPAQKPPRQIKTVEPPQQGVRRLLIETPAQTPQLHLSFHVGSATDPVTAPMNLLLKILADGDSSRLHQTLVEDEQLAINVGAFHSEGFDPGYVYFYLILPPGGDPAVVEARLMELLTDAATNGVSEAELAKARNITLADFWRQLATIDGKASLLGEREVFHGDFEGVFALPDELDQISVEDLSEAAALFRLSNATVGVLRSPAGEAAE